MRSPHNWRACGPLDGASDMVCRAGHDLGVGAVEVEDDDSSVVGQHVCARADLVDLAARPHLLQQVDGLTRYVPLAALPHTLERRRGRQSGFRFERFPYPTAYADLAEAAEGRACSPETTDPERDTNLREKLAAQAEPQKRQNPRFAGALS